MTVPLRIAVADDEPDMQDYFQKILPRLGHEVVAVAASGDELLRKCLETKPDLVITDINMPGLDGIAAAVELYREHPAPVILVSAYHDRELIERAEADHVMAYLVKPVKQGDLEPAIAIAVRRFAQFQELRREAADLRQALQDRKVVERAKGLLMRLAGLDESAAHARLQKLASEKNLKLIEVAKSLLLAEEAMAVPAAAKS